MYQERSYRALQKFGGAKYRVVVEETDLWIASERDLSHVVKPLIAGLRHQIIEADRPFPGFTTTLEPMAGHSEVPLVESMLKAARRAGVGPMAAVAGAIAQAVGERIHEQGLSRNLCVENGGDIYMDSDCERVILLHAGPSPLSERVGIRLRHEQFPLGVCTSAGTVGHSLSFGNADAAVILARDAALADAVATAAGNRLKTPQDMQQTLEFVQGIPGIAGCVLVIGEHLGAWGEVELVGV